MRFSTALVVGFAAATSAFLVPPNFAEDFKDTRFKDGPPEHIKDFVHALLEQKTTTIDLACPSCPYIVEVDGEDNGGNALSWETGIDSVIHLEFKTHGRDFNLNGHTIIPLEHAQKDPTHVVKAHQTRLDTNEQSIDVPLNFAMEIMPPIPSPHNDEVSLIPIEFTVLGLNGVPIKVNTIAFKLIETPNKDLVIVRTEQIPFHETPGAVTCEGAKPWSLCRLRAIIAARISSLMESARQKAGKVQGWVKEKTHHHCKGKRPHKEEHHHKHGGHKHHDEKHHDKHHDKHHNKHHNKHHKLGHMLRQTFRFFIIPALLGVIGGLTASAVGMLVGQAIVLMWFRTYRQGRRGPLRIVEQEVAIEENEKDALVVEGCEMPPRYEDAPRYEEAVMPQDEKH